MPPFTVTPLHHRSNGSADNDTACQSTAQPTRRENELNVRFSPLKGGLRINSVSVLKPNVHQNFLGNCSVAWPAMERLRADSQQLNQPLRYAKDKEAECKKEHSQFLAKITALQDDVSVSTDVDKQKKLSTDLKGACPQSEKAKEDLQSNQERKRRL